MKWLMYYLIVVNLLTWIIYGIDKWKAKRRAWRIPERTLLLLAAAGGCTGALAGMLMFQAQDKKTEIHDWSTGYFCSGKYFLCIYFSEIVTNCT